MRNRFLIFSLVVFSGLIAGGEIASVQAQTLNDPFVQNYLKFLVSGQTKKKKGGIPLKYRPAVEKGLKWLASQQHKDGFWGANGDNYPVAMTAMAGMALLMEGSTIRQGPYSKNIRMATDWLMSRVQKGELRDGLIGNPNNQKESYRYMYGHGFGLLFLASVYGDEANVQRRAELKAILERAVKYTAAAQSSRGGWYYTSRKEGGDQDEGSVTITQIQALRACKNAGIAVPKEIIKKTYEYLKMCTNPTTGALYYSFTSKQDRVAITAAAVACMFNAGEYKDPLGKGWLKYCHRTIPEVGGVAPAINLGHHEYTHYYFAQCLYILGDDGWEKLFGKTPENERVTWSGYRAKLFDELLGKQRPEGSWFGGGGFSSVGPVYSTAVYLTVMQLDNNLLPIYQR